MSRSVDEATIGVTGAGPLVPMASDGAVGARGQAGLAPADNELSATSGDRLRVAKAYKMFVGGAFVRSESGHSFQIQGLDTGGEGADPTTVNVPLGSRKDVRDAVLAAKNAQAKWGARTAYNRGQILYRMAEVMESRTLELADSLERSGVRAKDALREVSVAIDRSVYYAGFCDKISALYSSHNPVSGPHFAFTVPEPMGVVGVVAPSAPALLGLVSTVLPAIASGNVVVALASETDPRTAILWCECLATSDLPAGVVNVLTGRGAELAPHLATHRELHALDATIPATAEGRALCAELARLGADNVKRVHTRPSLPTEAWIDERRGQGFSWIERYLEGKTIWHPVGI